MGLRASFEWTLMTHDELLAALQAHTADRDADFVDSLPVIISNSEHFLSKSLDMTAEVVIWQSISVLPAGTYLLNKPPGWLASRMFSLIDRDNVRRILEKRDTTVLTDFWPDRDLVGVPRYYADWDVETFLIVPSLDIGTYTAELEYEARVTGLSADNPETWLSINHPRLLLMTCLMEASLYHKNPALLEIYRSERDRELELTRVEFALSRSDATSVRRAG